MKWTITTIVLGITLSLTACYNNNDPQQMAANQAALNNPIFVGKNKLGQSVYLSKLQYDGNTHYFYNVNDIISDNCKVKVDEPLMEHTNVTIQHEPPDIPQPPLLKVDADIINQRRQKLLDEIAYLNTLKH